MYSSLRRCQIRSNIWTFANCSQILRSFEYFSHIHFFLLVRISETNLLVYNIIKFNWQKRTQSIKNVKIQTFIRIKFLSTSAYIFNQKLTFLFAPFHCRMLQLRKVNRILLAKEKQELVLSKKYWEKYKTRFRIGWIMRIISLVFCVLKSEWHIFVLLKIEPIRICQSLRFERGIPGNNLSQNFRDYSGIYWIHKFARFDWWNLVRYRLIINNYYNQ